MLISKKIGSYLNPFKRKNGKNNKQKEIFFTFNSYNKISKKPVFVISPLLQLIQSNKKIFLNNLLQSLHANFSLRPKIGVELEFYLYDSEKNRFIQKSSYQKKISGILYNIYKESILNNILIIKPEKEKGGGQIEIKTEPYSDIIKLAEDINLLKQKICEKSEQEGFCANFKAQPFLSDCGNALQINISLTNFGGGNAFARDFNEDEATESNELLYSVGGLCEAMHSSMPFFVKNRGCYKRYNVDVNKFLHKQGKYPAPTFVSWGVNNRTAAIRIPVPDFKDVQQYRKEDARSRRIEHRVPSGEADIYLTIIGVLSGILYGLKNEISPPQKQSFNVFESEEESDKILHRQNTFSKDFKDLLLSIASLNKTKL